MSILLFIAFVAVFADLLAPHDPQIGSLARRFQPPFWQEGGSLAYLLGTDHVGRDVLSRLIFGARVSMVVGITAVLVAGGIGTLLGIISGYLGGWVDQVIMRITDTWLALPALTFAIFLAAIVGPERAQHHPHPGPGLLDALRPRHPRRGAVAEAARVRAAGRSSPAAPSRSSCGATSCPTSSTPPIVLATLMLGVVIVTEASLSFLGVGVPPPKPAWGLMLADGKKGLMVGYWWLTVFPGICIMLMVLSANLLGDWLRVKLDPQLRQL